MVSRKFNVYRYRYEADNNRNYIREQRIMVNPADNQELVPVTPTFLLSVVSLPDSQKKIKAEKFNNKERRCVVQYLNTMSGRYSETDRYIPFNQNERIVNQLKEQRMGRNVLCLEYYGESQNYQIGKFI